MRIVIADDHPVVCNGLEQILNMEEDFEVVAKASCSQEGIEKILSQKPDLAIVDMRMPGGGGLDIIRKTRALVPKCRFIILSSYISPVEIREAISENVEGYVLKEALPQELIQAIRRVIGGRKYYDPEIMDSIINREEKDPLTQLTNREIDIIDALAEGLNNQAIAEKLYISENTVKKHIGNILDKLSLKDRTQAALYGFSRGFGNSSRTYNYF